MKTLIYATRGPPVSRVDVRSRSLRAREGIQRHGADRTCAAAAVGLRHAIDATTIGSTVAVLCACDIPPAALGQATNAGLVQGTIEL